MSNTVLFIQNVNCAYAVNKTDISKCSLIPGFDKPVDYCFYIQPKGRGMAYNSLIIKFVLNIYKLYKKQCRFFLNEVKIYFVYVNMFV